jgi:glycosyltransferase involved in cell wall biosynthesis
MESKKVLFISNMYPTEKHKSFGIFVKNQVEALREKGLEVDVVAINDPRGGKVNVSRKYFSWVTKSFLRLLFKGKSYDVIHAHYVFPSGIMGLLAKKLYKTRFIVTAHGGDIDKMARKNERIFKWTKQILNRADHVIAVGDDLVKNIHEDFHVPKENLSLLNMGVNRQVFKENEKQKSREQVGLDSSEMSILFVGNVIRQKGLVELINALGMLKNEGVKPNLYIIGPTHDQAFLEELIQKSKTCKVTNMVNFIGVKSQNEVAQWMSAADLFVLPSHIEGFGLVALEAMSCGTPVVGSNVGGLRYLLSNNSGRLIEPKDATSLAEGLKDVLLNKELQKTIVLNGLKKAAFNDQENIIQSLLKLYFPTGG